MTPETGENAPSAAYPQDSAVKWRYLCNAMEMALALGDLQKDANNLYTPSEFCDITLESIHQLIEFKAAAIYLVESETSDLVRSAISPDHQSRFIDDEMRFLIDQGVIAWAIRERRGITVFSRDGRHQLQLHVIATYARIRGLFIGIFPEQLGHRPDGASEFLSLMLRSVATSLESIEYVALLNKKNKDLMKEVDKKMDLLLDKERELANTRKLNAIASLAGGIAHEFNNTLTALIGYNDLARMTSNDHDMVLQYTEKAASGLDRLASLTNQLLSYSRGGMYKTQRASLNKLANEALSKLKKQMADTVHVNGPSTDTGNWITCDVGQIRQVLSSVLLNAKEAIDAHGTIAITVRTYSENDLPARLGSKLQAGSYVALTVADDGCGMDRETRERMFEPFFSTKFTGRGLSMAAVHGILENHRGSIVVDSQVNGGTTVTICLPASD